MAIKRVLKSLAKKAIKAKPKAEKLYGALKKGAMKAGKKSVSLGAEVAAGAAGAAGYSMLKKKRDNKKKKSMRKRK